MIGLLCAAGEFSNKDLFEKAYDFSDIRLAVDGGIIYYKEYKKDFDIAVGDFDSIDEKYLDELLESNKKIERLQVEKDYTDFEYAVELLISKNCSDIYILGAMGTRLDHTIANLNYSRACFKRGINLYFLSNNNIISYLGESKKIKKIYKYTSILPLSDEGMRISLEGFKYDCKDLFVGFSTTRAISNEIKDKFAKIELISGDGLLIFSKDK